MKIDDDFTGVIVFTAAWCNSCTLVKDKLDILISKSPVKNKVQEVNVATEKGSKFAAKHGVRTLPTLLFFKDGFVNERIVGNVAVKTLECAYKLIDGSE